MTRLEQLRLDAHLTPEALGRLAKVAGGTIRSIEAGTVVAQVATLGKLADHFKVPASELLRPAVFGGPVDGAPETERAA